MDTSWIGPFLEGISDCVSCGKCLSECPLYDFQRREEWSPRGKLNVLKWYLASGGQPTPASALMFFQCTLCLRCQDACPSGIAMREIFQAARANLERLGLAPHAPCLKRAIRGGPAQPGPLCRAIAAALHRARANRSRSSKTDRHIWERQPLDAAFGRNREDSGTKTAAMLVLSPLLLGVAPGAAAAAADLARRAGFDPVPWLLSGTSLFRRFWGGDPAGLQETIRKEDRRLPPGRPRLFAEPDLAAWWREGLAEESAPSPVLDLLDLPHETRSAARQPPESFTVLPLPRPLDRRGWQDWNDRWAARQLPGWQPAPDEWRALRAEGLNPFYPSTARALGRSLLAAAAAAGLQELVLPSVRTFIWLRDTGGESPAPRLTLLPAFLNRLQP
jgi:formate hydrogenlyase subunit 6/NADH:ubiquinone oxidoreductase subunit I